MLEDMQYVTMDNKGGQALLNLEITVDVCKLVVQKVLAMTGP